MKTYMKIFMYFFVMIAIFGMTTIFSSEYFQKSFNTLDIMDISRMVLINIIKLVIGLLIIDTYMRFNEISNVKKTLLLVIAIPSSMFVCAFLTPIEF
ncbi:hypothetical protein FQ087_12765 [Sporosarcina sp. ANT_H38]|uniref:hypothetical protein n=1 Tax=Sporosarcina sp. ANT_H38 TaxID=2597358 RepID=UPI0011F34E3E|nr:hypothetical protein [Sporosarcina sp. ANT_H38]KAA0955478.1 hypothetical protein FQ087_12765 [Sporosarcina sp. ANT_H38]